MDASLLKMLFLPTKKLERCTQKILMKKYLKKQLKEHYPSSNRGSSSKGICSCSPAQLHPGVLAHPWPGVPAHYQPGVPAYHRPGVPHHQPGVPAQLQLGVPGIVSAGHLLVSVHLADTQHLRNMSEISFEHDLLICSKHSEPIVRSNSKMQVLFLEASA